MVPEIGGLTLRLFEAIIDEVGRREDGSVESLLLGWRGAAVLLEDGRFGLARVTLSEEMARPSPRDPTEELLQATARELTRLFVSPYPAEFALASAASEALLPPPEGLPAEVLRSLIRGDRASVVGYDPDLVLLFRSWRWELAIFDDIRRAPDVYPSWTENHLLQGAPWVFLSSDALRDRRILSLAPHFRQSQGTVLVGPGLPWIPNLYRELAISHLLSPVVVGDPRSVLRFLAAGGSLWESPDLEWQLCPVTEPF
jgi:uncharacterized protein (DUF4213/DUF364 family)